ncbi:MAG: carbon-nitrogen hydrolase family protein [Myxococcota bacterium]
MGFLAAAVQMTSIGDVAHNLSTAERLIEKAATRGAVLISLPENFAFMGPSEREKLAMAEPLDGPIITRLREAARRHKVTLTLGGFQERSNDPERPHNSHVVIGPDGNVVANYRKVHLFDVELADGSVHKESRHTMPGTSVVTCALPAPVNATLGLSICYDLRFPELYRKMVERGARVLLVPAAFTLHTGKDHWEVLLRARAIENLSYVIAAAQFGKHNDKRVTWGKSMIIDPWGSVIARCSDREDVCVAEIDLDYAQELGKGLPCLTHRRPDVVEKA